MSYRFVDAQKADGFPVTLTCEVAGVSTSGFYDWKKHRDGVATVTELADACLVSEIKTIHDESDGTYGEARVTVELGRRGWVVNDKRVERLMRLHGIIGHTPKKKTRATIPAAVGVSDLVRGDFTKPAPDVAWAGDITYIPTWERFLYLAAVEDLGSPRILGALRWPTTCAQTWSVTPSGRLLLSEAARSVGRTGICWDNAVIESWFAILKKEMVHRRVFRTRAEARLAIRAWIAWYNARRLHSTLDYLTPTEWEEQHYRLSIDHGTKAA